MSKIDEPIACINCGEHLKRTPKMFHWRGEFFDGMYCKDCNAAWVIEEEKGSEKSCQQL